jgi:hypothetical protein
MKNKDDSKINYSDESFTKYTNYNDENELNNKSF